jgi:L-amino acid N-acyltransferase YncA
VRALLDDMVETRIEWTSALVRSWYDPAALAGQLRRGLTRESDRIGDEVFGTEFRDAVGVDVPAPLAWANRRLELASDGWAVTGIRFRALDVTRPFVDVVATTAPPTADGLAAVAAAAEREYRPFAPLCLRVAAPSPADLLAELADDDRFESTSSIDMSLLAGLVSDLRERPRASSFAVVALRPGEPEPLAERVAAVYAERTGSEPAQAMWATPEDVESLGECAEEGLLFEVLVHGEPAGVVAAMREDAHGLAGFEVEEICLDAAHRGRRLAPATLQRLVDELPARPGDVLWGTIHPDNQPSLRNALSIGRQVVGGYLWVTPAGWPGMPRR